MIALGQAQKALHLCSALHYVGVIHYTCLAVAVVIDHAFACSAVVMVNAGKIVCNFLHCH